MAAFVAIAALTVLGALVCAFALAITLGARRIRADDRGLPPGGPAQS
jgi:hypothetical protein